ncbi:hypothetical protein OHB01_34230 [Microbispora hainanensis]|uniref:hypothetical protein n=1 Tax=Microbispora TaxID=2005 RepID=UPI00163D2DF8|nr:MULTISPECIES: hypothetical protein [Microbispora]
MPRRSGSRQALATDVAGGDIDHAVTRKLLRPATAASTPPMKWERLGVFGHRPV